ncbi:hypothetical protein K8S17_05965 [bacterium]|nr:hypothetical protein [bacterium]
MTSFRRLGAGFLTLALVAVPLAAMLLLSGCRTQEELVLDTNLPPNTRLTSAPAPYAQMNYRVHMHWSGSDPDGYVVGYYFAWDDTMPGVGAAGSAWTFTGESDSLFKAVIDTAGETRRHTFYVRALDNEGAIDPSPARVRFDASTTLPVIDVLYRLEGPEDPDGGDYNPGYKDTVLMGTPCTFTWSGHDPDGQGAPVQYSYRLDSNPDSQWTDDTTFTATDITSTNHLFYVRARDETGAWNFPASYRFVMNYEPDSEIIEPEELSGTLTVADKDTFRVTWVARDREQLEGAGGGIVQIWIELDNERIQFAYDEPPYTGEWYYTSTAPTGTDHYIFQDNINTGGNKEHVFRIWAIDAENRVEVSSTVPGDREYYRFWYNFPPTTEVTFPLELETVGPDFTVTWEGTDVDGDVAVYQYVLDPEVNGLQITEETEMTYSGISTGLHRFWIRARDDADCWETEYLERYFYVEDAE